ncbi:lipoprotein HlpB [Lonepinella sp. MS14435]|uniref:lipoprotein HlpB n=1 Tax=Lonepinella sp. MS14435 TaxID=3003618 RepID=UPI0036DB554F
MNKFTKITAVSLFALFLTACDKPAENAQQTTQNPQSHQVTLNVNEQNIDDVRKFLDWDAKQIAILKDPQEVLKKASESKDPTKIKNALKQLTDKANEVLADADNLGLKDTNVNLLKDKAKENLALSVIFVNESFGYLVQGKQPTEEEKQQLNATYQKLAASAQELQQVREKLYQILAPKPAQEHAKPAK